MEWITVTLLGTGLAMDCFAVSVVSGAIYHDLHLKHIFRMAFFFGIFQAGMPVLGLVLALIFREHLAAYGSWAAFALLTIIGVKMIYESFKIDKISRGGSPANFSMVIMFAFATSIDALAAGVTLSLLTDELKQAIVILGLIAFLLTVTGVYVGKQFKHFAEKRLEAIGGLILIGIGLKELLEHLLG